MTSAITITTVEGKVYKVWSDYIMRCTYAENEEGIKHMIRSSGYLSNDLSIRKAIKLCFHLKTFRK